MPNTNGMRFPMTALRDFDLDGKSIKTHQVFDAVGIARYNELKNSGDAAMGDLHNSPHEISQLPSAADGAAETNGTLNARGPSTAAGSVVDESEGEEGKNRTELTGSVIATGDADPTNQAGVGGSLGSVPPEVPELSKTDPGFLQGEPATSAPGSAINATENAVNTEGTENASTAVQSDVRDEATATERAAAKGEATTKAVTTGASTASNTKTTNSKDAKAAKEATDTAKTVRRSR